MQKKLNFIYIFLAIFLVAVYILALTNRVDWIIFWVSAAGIYIYLSRDKIKEYFKKEKFNKK